MNLKEYLKAQKERPTVWGKRHGLSPSLISKVMANKQGNLSLKNALKLVAATHGAVEFQDLVPKPKDNGAGQQEATKK